jgi:hypothetical protein
MPWNPPEEDDDDGGDDGDDILSLVPSDAPRQSGKRRWSRHHHSFWGAAGGKSKWREYTLRDVGGVFEVCVSFFFFCESHSSFFFPKNEKRDGSVQ